MDYFTNSLLGKVNSRIIGREIKDIQYKYKDSKTLESKFVRDINKIKLILQILDYKRPYKHKLDLGDFSQVISKIKLPKVKEQVAKVLREHEEFWDRRPYIAYSAEEPLEEKSLA